MLRCFGILLCMVPILYLQYSTVQVARLRSRLAYNLYTLHDGALRPGHSMFPSISTDLRKSTPPSDSVRYEWGT